MTVERDDISPELTDGERDALAAWTTLLPPADFASRVLAKRDAGAPPARRRWPAIVALAATASLAAGATAIVTTRDAPPRDRTAAGALAATGRTEQWLGDRAVAVAEANAAIAWRVDRTGATEVEQSRGEVFYRVDRSGGAFVVHTPAGDVRVTGTCFRIVIHEPEDAMTKTQQLLISGTLGAAVATAAVVIVYEGHVIAETRSAKTELAAGTQARLDGGNGTIVASADPTASGAKSGGPIIVRRVPGEAVDPATATREQLVAANAEQKAELQRLRAQLAELASAGPRGAGGGDDESNGDGRPWHDPSPETLKAWAKECRIQADEPGYDRWQPQPSLGRNDRGLEPSELPAYNEALAEVQKEWKAYVRALYLETTNDIAGADSLSIEAMRHEIEQKSTDSPGDVMQRIANERAGLAQPPADISKLSTAERMLRAYVELGDKTEAALAKRLGPERAKAIRGEAWGSRSRMAGCPDGN